MRVSENSYCPICSMAQLTKHIISEAFKYKHKSITIDNYVVYRCCTCGGEIVDKESLKRTGPIIREFISSIDTELI